MSKSKFISLLAADASKYVLTNILEGENKSQLREVIDQTLHFDGPIGFEHISEPTNIHNIRDFKDGYLYEIMSGYSEIDSCLQKLRIINRLLLEFPFSKFRVSRTSLLSFLLELYLNQVYVLQLRLVAFTRVLPKLHKRDPARDMFNRVCKDLQKEINVYFDRFKTTRGSSVHHKQTTSKDIDHLGLLELLTKGDPAMKRVFSFHHNELRKRWCKEISNQNRKIAKRIDSYFYKLAEILFDKNGRLIYLQRPDRA